jgi:uncharacterized protein (DUF1800 family)
MILAGAGRSARAAIESGKAENENRKIAAEINPVGIFLGTMPLPKASHLKDRIAVFLTNHCIFPEKKVMISLMIPFLGQITGEGL